MSIRCGAAGPIFLLLLLALSGCQSLPRTGDPEDAESGGRRERIAAELVRVREEIRPLSLDLRSSPTESERAFFRHYRLDLPVAHAFGSVDSPVAPLAVHVFRPERAAGTVFFLHGYFDHVGSHGHTIRALVDVGYAVVAFDLPGHGLSGGPRAEVEAIPDYARALRAVLAAVAGEVPAPWHFVGHSAGCTAVLDPLLGGEELPFAGIVLVAPLVRSAWWGASCFCSEVAGWFVEDIERHVPVGSADPEIERLRRYEDPLQHDRFPLRWFEALEAWQERIEDAAPVEREILVVQGDEDRTIAWRWNLEFIEDKFSAAEVRRIPGGHHELLSEPPEIRAPVIAAILERLAAASPRDGP